MDLEKAEHLNLLAVVLVFLLVLTYIADQFVKNATISVSIGLIITSFVIIFLLFSEITGISLLAFVLVFGFVVLLVNSIVLGLFISALILGAFVLLNVLTR